MHKILSELKDFGCAIDSGLERMLDDEDFYIDCLKSFCSENEYQALLEDLKVNNIQKAFDDAHALKGVTANLSLTPLNDEVCKVVEPLRAGTTEGIAPHVKEVGKVLEQIKCIVGIC